MFGPAPFIGGGLRLEFFDNSVFADDTGTDIITPAAIEEGDFILHLDLVSRALGATPVKVVPTGYTEIADTTVTGTKGYRMISSGKIAGASDSSVAVTGMGGAANENLVRKQVLVFRANKAMTGFSVFPAPANNQGTSGNPTAQTVGASGGEKPVVVFGCYGMGNESGSPIDLDPRTFTIGGNDAKDAEIEADDDSGPFTSQTNQTWIAYKIMNTAGQLADVSVDTDDNGLNLLQSFWVEFTSA